MAASLAVANTSAASNIQGALPSAPVLGAALPSGPQARPSATTSLYGSSAPPLGSSTGAQPSSLGSTLQSVYGPFLSAVSQAASDRQPFREAAGFLSEQQLQAYAATLYPMHLQTTQQNVVLQRSLEYVAYDVFVERMNMALDLTPEAAALRQRWPQSEAPARTQWAHGMHALRLLGSPRALFSFRLRGLYALLRTEIHADDEPYQLRCLSTLGVDTNVPLAASIPIWATGAGSFLDVACASGHTCRRCLQLYALAGSGSTSGERLWGTGDYGCVAERVALAEVLLRTWLCEEQGKRRAGVGPYWAARRAALALDRWQAPHVSHMHDTASVGVPGAMGTCSDMGKDEVLGNTFADDFHIRDSRLLGAHCALVHDMLWPHRTRLLELAARQMAAVGLDGASCAVGQLPSGLLRAAVLQLAWELLEAGAPLQGFVCPTHAVAANDLRFRFLQRYPSEGGACGRSLTALGGREHAHAARWYEAGLDPVRSASKNSVNDDTVVFLRWLLRQLHSGAGGSAGGGAAVGEVLQPVEAALDAWVRGLADLSRSSHVRQLAPIADLYWALHEAAAAATRRGLHAVSPCPSARNGACGWLHGKRVPLRAVLADAAAPLVVFNHVSRLRRLAQEAMRDMEVDFTDWQTRFGAFELKAACSAAPPLCATVGECYIALDHEARRWDALLPEMVYNTGLPPRRVLATLDRAACVMFCLAHQLSRRSAGRDDWLEMAHELREALPMFEHHHQRIDGTALGATIFNHYAGSHDTLSEHNQRLSRDKIADFLAQRTANVPYNAHLRKTEEQFVRGIFEQKDARDSSERFVGHAHALTGFMARERGCTCDRTVKAADVKRPDDGRHGEEGDEGEEGEEGEARAAGAAHAPLLSCPTAFAPAAHGGFRPRCPAEQPKCLSPWAVARIARELGPLMQDAMLAAELPPDLGREARKRIQTRPDDDLLL